MLVTNTCVLREPQLNNKTINEGENKHCKNLIHYFVDFGRTTPIFRETNLSLDRSTHKLLESKIYKVQLDTQHNLFRDY